MRKCKKCNDFLPIECYYKHMVHGYRYECKKCFLKQSKYSREKRKIDTNGLYKIWDGIKTRCLCKKVNKYPRYAGRGIRVCSEWSVGFNSFYKWALNNGYEKGLQIDRIDNNGDYKPSNCRFVTLEVNSQNRSTSKLNGSMVIEIKKMLRLGIKQKEIARIYNVKSPLISKIKTKKCWKNII